MQLNWPSVDHIFPSQLNQITQLDLKIGIHGREKSPKPNSPAFDYSGKKQLPKTLEQDSSITTQLKDLVNQHK